MCGHVARMALCALVAAYALAHIPPLLAQEPGVSSPAQNRERLDALAERVEELEGEGEPVTEARLSVPYVVLTAVAGTQLAYLTVQMFRNRARPVLSWTVRDDGDGFELRDMPDGSKRIAVRITNVGQAAAVDIVWHAGTRVSARATRNIPLDASPHFVGSLYPSASAQVLIAVSSAEHAKGHGRRDGVLFAGAALQVHGQPALHAQDIRQLFQGQQEHGRNRQQVPPRVGHALWRCLCDSAGAAWARPCGAVEPPGSHNP